MGRCALEMHLGADLLATDGRTRMSAAASRLQRGWCGRQPLLTGRVPAQEEETPMALSAALAEKADATSDDTALQLC
jgi:hypothetical protein